MSQFVGTPTKTFPVAAAIAKYALVKLDSTGKVSLAVLGEQPIGTLENQSFAADDLRSVRLLSSGGTMKMLASGAFAAGAKVYGRAAGKIDDISTTSAVLVGIAMEAAGAADDVVEVMPII